MEKLKYEECEKCTDWDGTWSNCIDICGKPDDALEEFNQYRAVGTIEECREAREKQIPKKAILDTIYHQDYYCPCCEMFIYRKSWEGRKDKVKSKNCRHCGQAIDWGGDHNA